MGVLSRSWLKKDLPEDAISPTGPSFLKSSDLKLAPVEGVTTHVESTARNSVSHFQTHNTTSTHDGDVAANLFRSPTDLHQSHAQIDPAVERRLVRRIDWMILPYLAVCYAFFYIDKTTLSYAAIFGIKTDLHLVGTDYNWLSSIFYFGFLAWAIPTNFGLQRFPVGKYLGGNICAWGILLMLQAAANVRSYLSPSLPPSILPVPLLHKAPFLRNRDPINELVLFLALAEFHLSRRPPRSFRSCRSLLRSSLHAHHCHVVYPAAATCANGNMVCC